MKIKQRFLITDLESTQLTTDEKKWLVSDLLYGIVLFSKNYQDRPQLTQLIESIKKINPTLKIFVDQEGGRVQRFKKDFKKIKPMRHFGLDFDYDQKTTTKQIKKTAKIMAKELIQVGVDVNFAPVIDCDYGKKYGAIGDRSFHQEPKVVYQLAKKVVEGFQSQGLKACLKHFPGHGFVDSDTHLHFTKDQRSFQKLLQEMQIYFWLIDYFKQQIQYIMISHIVYSCFDELPVFLSHKWISYLREVIGFKGKIISDDLMMQAALEFGSVNQLVKDSLNAGCDLLIVCNNQRAREDILLL